MMGGKGSGRRSKPLVLVIDELLEEVQILREDCEALHKKVDRVTARWRYWLKKTQRKERMNSVR